MIRSPSQKGAGGGCIDPPVELRATAPTVNPNEAPWAMGVPDIYTDADPKASSDLNKKGELPIDFGKAWIKSPKLTAGQASIMHYNRDLMMAILWDRMPYLSAMLNTEVIALEQAPGAYKTFSDGSPKKFVIDPHGSVKKAA